MVCNLLQAGQYFGYSLQPYELHRTIIEFWWGPPPPQPTIQVAIN